MIMLLFPHLKTDYSSIKRIALRTQLHFQYLNDPACLLNLLRKYIALIVWIQDAQWPVQWPPCSDPKYELEGSQEDEQKSPLN
jgi:hypothetical protein